MGPWDQIKAKLDGPDSARYRSFIVHCTGRRQLACFVLAVAGSGCMYTILHDPDNPMEFLAFGNGSVEELREVIEYLSQFPEARPGTE